MKKQLLKDAFTLTFIIGFFWAFVLYILPFIIKTFYY